MPDSIDTFFSGAVMLGNDEVKADFLKGLDGRTFGLVHLGRRVKVHVTEATPETLDQVAAAFAELAEWKRRGGLSAVAS